MLLHARNTGDDAHSGYEFDAFQLGHFFAIDLRPGLY
jgi:hypothetical protein